MATRKKTNAKKPAKKLSPLDLAKSDAMVLLGRLEELGQAIVRLQERLAAADRVAYVTVEGVVLEMELVDEEERRVSDFNMPLLRSRASKVASVRPFGWTQAVPMRHVDTRTSVRFEPMRKMRVERVLVHGAGSIGGVRVGREFVTPGAVMKGQSVYQIGRVCELGSCITVDVEPVVVP